MRKNAWRLAQRKAWEQAGGPAMSDGQIEAIDAAIPAERANRVMDALNEAIDHSLANVPDFGGHTLVVLDSSGSMSGAASAAGAMVSAYSSTAPTRSVTKEDECSRTAKSC